MVKRIPTAIPIKMVATVHVAQPVRECPGACYKEMIKGRDCDHGTCDKPRLIEEQKQSTLKEQP